MNACCKCETVDKRSVAGGRRIIFEARKASPWWIVMNDLPVLRKCINIRYLVTNVSCRGKVISERSVMAERSKCMLSLYLCQVDCEWTKGHESVLICRWNQEKLVMTSVDWCVNRSCETHVKEDVNHDNISGKWSKVKQINRKYDVIVIGKVIVGCLWKVW